MAATSTTQRDPPPTAGEQIVRMAGVHLVVLVVGLVEGEQAADREQHDRHDERVDVALPPVPERMLRIGFRVDLFDPSSSSPWLPESAIEWIDSASIDAAPVSSQAMSLVTAMPRLATSAAMIARGELSVLTGQFPCRH